MKILSRGKEPSELEYRGKCDRCKMTYSAHGNELKIVPCAFGGEPFARMKCQFCEGETVYLNPKSMFDNIYDKLDSPGITTAITAVCYMITAVMSVYIVLTVAHIVSIISGGHK